MESVEALIVTSPAPLIATAPLPESKEIIFAGVEFTTLYFTDMDAPLSLLMAGAPVTVKSLSPNVLVIC